jgi:hypothetical protein
MNLLPLQLELKLQAVTAFAPAAPRNKQTMISDHSCMIYSNGNSNSGSSNYKSCTAELALDVVCCFPRLGCTVFVHWDLHLAELNHDDLVSH